MTMSRAMVPRDPTSHGQEEMRSAGELALITMELPKARLAMTAQANMLMESPSTVPRDCERRKRTRGQIRDGRPGGEEGA